MGIILILIGGLIGAGSGLKKPFISCWIFLINLAFSLYVSIFLSPLAVPLLEIPGLDAGYKNAIAVSGIFIIFNIILQKITEQIIPNPENDFNLPAVSKIFSVAAGFLSGILIVGILLFCFMQTPFVSGLSQRKELRATARKTMMGVVYTLNAFSFQSLSPEAEKELQSIRLIPKKKTTPPAKAGEQGKDEPKDQSKPAENNPADESGKKDSAPLAKAGEQGKDEPKDQSKPAENNPADESKDSAKMPEKPAEDQKTDNND